MSAVVQPKIDRIDAGERHPGATEKGARMEWVELGLGVLATAAIILIPGLVVGLVLGFRGFAAFALAVPAGTTVIVSAALIAPIAGLRWGILPVLLVAAAVVLVAAGLRFALWRARALRFTVPGLSRVGVFALIGSCVVGAAQLLFVIGSPENISQTFDNIFHLNAIRYALDTGSASPLTIGSMTSAASGGLPFYPSGWHAVASLVVQLTGAGIPVVSNAVMIFFGALAWPVSVLLLTFVLFGSDRVVLVVAAAIAVAIPAFPLLLVEYGVLFPYMMSLSLIAVPLACVIEACRRASWADRWPLVVAAIGCLPGIAVAHPGGFVALLVFVSVVLAVAWLGLMFSAAGRRRKVLASVSAAVFIAIAVAAWYVLRPVADARSWLPTETVGQAVGEVLTASVWFAPINVVVAVLAATGAVVAARRRAREDWIALGFLAAAGGLYIVVSGVPYLTLRDILTGAWYNNAPRLAALLAFAWVPLAATGGQRLWTMISPWLARITGSGLRRGVVAVVAIVVLLVLPQTGSMRQAVASAHGAFAVTDESPLLTTDELALIHRLDRVVPEDAVILGSPWTGTALAYALADRRVVMPHTLMDITEDMSVLLDGLDSAEPGGKVCDAVDRLGVDYVLDFGEQEVNGGEHEYKGLDHLSSSSAVEEIDAVGDAVLYQIVLCG